jgi:hypothetical protein
MEAIMQVILADRELFRVRFFVGLIQGLALYLLYHAADGKMWPATDGLVFAPLLLAWLFSPVLLTLSLGEMPWRRAALWAGTAAVIIAVLGFYDNWSAWPLDWNYAPNPSHPTPVPHILPSAELFLFGSAGLFIAHALVMGGYADHSFRANYSTHFDTAWKIAVQMALAALFVGAFWLLLWLGAGLFQLIKLDFFRRLISHQWFSIPVTALAVAGALHITDIRPALVRGARTLLLTLLSWLLPLITLIITGFLVSLLFTGLAPLWSVGHASALLLVGAASLIILINAAHQDGDAERMPPKILRLSGTLAAILPTPLALIAAYALFLRIQQYGWTADRVIMAANVLVAIAYAAGYARAIVVRGRWLGAIEPWNFNVALLILAVLLALFSPIASPKRIAVADQMARLDSGRTASEKFDFGYLRWHGGRYGMTALNRLAQSKVGNMAEMARASLRQTNQYMAVPAEPVAFAARITVYPNGRSLPASFADLHWARGLLTFQLPYCANSIVAPCDAILTDLDGDGRAEILLIQGSNAGVQIFQDNGKGDWHQAGMMMLPFNCPAMADALRNGRFTISPPAHRWNDVAVEGRTLHINDAVGTNAAASCPK